MTKLKTMLYIIAVTLPVAAFGEITDPAKIDSTNDSWSQALNQGSSADLIKFYTADAVVLPPSSEILANHAAIKGYWDGLHRIGVNKYTVYDVDLKIEGNIAYQTALWEATRITPEGTTIEFDGNLSSVFERQPDGSWKIKLQSWN